MLISDKMFAYYVTSKDKELLRNANILREHFRNIILER